MPTPRCFDAKPKESWGLKPFCPAWPTYALPAEPSSLLSDAVRRALRPFASGVSAADLDTALAPRCAQRLCMRVQILRGRVYVVAPHAKRCAEFHTPASPCSPYQIAGGPACDWERKELRVTFCKNHPELKLKQLGDVDDLVYWLDTNHPRRR